MTVGIRKVGHAVLAHAHGVLERCIIGVRLFGGRLQEAG